MIFKKAGKIIEGIYMVGPPAMPVYLLDGEKPAIFDAGLAFLGIIYADGIRQISGHRQALDGQDAKNYFQKSMTHCRDFLNLVETSLIEEGGDMSKVIPRIKAIEYDPIQEPKQIEPAYLLNLEAKVKAIKKRLENRSGHLEFAN